ncbi:HpcH/HpaI aldolase family protein [Vibrio genomosp. F10]|uniref:HpcH/HpaI aldolase family protein n=1 Tax=Vibrio genomosp. F10 TaxID=723171 RepID=UPI00030478C2|nr:aldolase/citrate lyase family protein [Vibrio genomosp. F10]OEF04574.1 2,4-dihydroxyhept-2-ene-1,7-dioic acid aldolase [Vibrio genomosp. F10 str. 9ZB36]
MSLKRKLQLNKLTLGSWVTIGHPAIVDIMASAGFEWLVIDMEHTSIDLETAHNLISSVQANGMKALVRVSKNEEVIIKRVLDMGADGLVVPMVKSRIDALRAIDYAKYPPIGKRGVGLFRAQKYGLGFEGYKKWVEDELVIIAQIEHYEAVNNIEEIVDTDGIDGVIIGPYDLSGSLGYPGEYHREDVKEGIAKVLSVCKEKSIPSGFHVIESDPEKLLERVNEGCTFLAYSLDFFFLGDSVRVGMSKIKESLQ